MVFTNFCESNKRCVHYAVLLLSTRKVKNVLSKLVSLTSKYIDASMYLSNFETQNSNISFENIHYMHIAFYSTARKMYINSSVLQLFQSKRSKT